MDTKEAPSCFRNSGPETPAIPTFALMHYHRQFLLNDRVRDGNGCGLFAIITRLITNLKDKIYYTNSGD